MKIDISKSKNFIINLEKDKQRLIDSSKELSKLNILAERFNAIKHDFGIVGCGLSHLNLLSKFKDDVNNDFVLILEDDVCLVNLENKTIFEIPDDSDALYLGISRYGYVPSINGGVPDSVVSVEETPEYRRIFNMCSTHAIVYLSKKYINAVIDITNLCLKNNIPFDLGIASIHKNFKILTPKIPLFYQKDQPAATNFILN